LPESRHPLLFETNLNATGENQQHGYHLSFLLQ
jgi:hypothetical protein